MSRLLSKPGTNRHRHRGHFHDRNLIAAIDALRDVDLLQIVRQAIVKRFQAIDLALHAIELRQTLAEIERLRFPFLDVGLQIFHLLADGFPAGIEFFDRVARKSLIRFSCFVISSFSLMIFGCFGRRSFDKSVALRLE